MKRNAHIEVPHCPLHVGHFMRPFLDEHKMIVGKNFSEHNVYYRCPVVQNGHKCEQVAVRDQEDK